MEAPPFPCSKRWYGSDALGSCDSAWWLNGIVGGSGSTVSGSWDNSTTLQAEFWSWVYRHVPATSLRTRLSKVWISKPHVFWIWSISQNYPFWSNIRELRQDQKLFDGSFSPLSFAALLSIWLLMFKWHNGLLPTLQDTSLSEGVYTCPSFRKWFQARKYRA